MIVVFTGPTVPAAELAARPGLVVLGPAAQGDVYLAARERPWGIGLIDGFFEHVPAVWHKEILWAMAEGVHVFGAASMGALRAAELAAFGMVGVGRIYEQFRDDELDADDEVAVAHGGAEHGYRRVSEAIVDVRATLAAAADAGICTPEQASALLEAARRQYYPDRTWASILAAAGREGVDRGVLASLDAWLPGGRVHQKSRDGLAMVDAMLARRAEHPGPLQVDYAFQHTSAWEQLVQQMRSARLGLAAHCDVDDLLEELRLTGDERLCALAVKGARLRGFARQVADGGGLTISPDLVMRATQVFRRERGLFTAAATRAWLTAQALDGPGFYGLMTREARLHWAEAVSEPEFREHLADQLRALGCYGHLRARIDDKRERLPPSPLDLAGSGLADREALWRWYFNDHLGRPVPEDVAMYAERLGFADLGALFRAVLRERWYQESLRPG